MSVEIKSIDRLCWVTIHSAARGSVNTISLNVFWHSFNEYSPRQSSAPLLISVS